MNITQSLHNLIVKYRDVYKSDPEKIVCGDAVFRVLADEADPIMFVKDKSFVNKFKFMGIPIEIDFIVHDRIYLLPLLTESD